MVFNNVERLLDTFSNIYPIHIYKYIHIQYTYSIHIYAYITYLNTDINAHTDT